MLAGPFALTLGMAVGSQQPGLRPARRPCPEQFTVYRWPDGSSMVRVLEEVRWINQVRQIYAQIEELPSGALDYAASLEHQYQQSLAWGVDRRGLAPRAISNFTLLNPDGTPAAAVVMRSFISEETVPGDTRLEVPRLSVVMTGDGPRVVRPELQGKLLEWLYNFVYANVELMHGYMGSFFSLGMPVPWEDDRFEPMVSSDVKSDFDRAVRLIGEKLHYKRVRRFGETAEIYVSGGLGGTIDPHSTGQNRPRLQVAGSRPQRLYEAHWAFKFFIGGAPIHLMLQLHLEPDGSWIWVLQHEFIAEGLEKPPVFRELARGNDLVQVFHDARVFSPRTKYWELVNELVVEGRPTVDLEPWDLLEALPPIFFEPERLCAEVVGLGWS